MATLHKQVWIKQILEGFYPDRSFLKYVTDLSKLVDNDKINLAEAGVDPKILINNMVYPINMSFRVDSPISIELDKFETENTVVSDPETIEYSYDQLESVIHGHRAALQTITAQKAAYAYAPISDGEYTPVIKTTGEVEGNRKRLRYVDIVELKNRFDMAEIPLDKRYLVLNSQHVSDLLLEDVKLFKDLTDLKNGIPFNFAGFYMLQFSRTPKYTIKGDGFEKLSYKASAESQNFSSFAFQSGEVMKADGNLHMYSASNDPKFRGTIIGFDKRFIAATFRNKGIGAIVSDNA